MKLKPHFKLNIYKASHCLFCLGFLTDINLFAIQQCHKVLACSNPLNAHALELKKDVFADDFFYPLTPMSDQDRISPNIITTISTR